MTLTFESEIWRMCWYFRNITEWLTYPNQKQTEIGLQNCGDFHWQTNNWLFQPKLIIAIAWGKDVNVVLIRVHTILDWEIGLWLSCHLYSITWNLCILTRAWCFAISLNDKWHVINAYKFKLWLDICEWMCWVYWDLLNVLCMTRNKMWNLCKYI